MIRNVIVLTLLYVFNWKVRKTSLTRIIVWELISPMENWICKSCVGAYVWLSNIKHKLDEERSWQIIRPTAKTYSQANTQQWSERFVCECSHSSRSWLFQRFCAVGQWDSGCSFWRCEGASPDATEQNHWDSHECWCVSFQRDPCSGKAALRNRSRTPTWRFKYLPTN